MFRIMTYKEQVIKKQHEIDDLMDKLINGELKELKILKEKELNKLDRLIFSTPNWLKVNYIKERIDILNEIHGLLCEYRDLLNKKAKQDDDNILHDFR